MIGAIREREKEILWRHHVCDVFIPRPRSFSHDTKQTAERRHVRKEDAESIQQFKCPFLLSNLFIKLRKSNSLTTFCWSSEVIVFKTSASDVKNCILRVPSPALNRISFSADDGTLEDSLSAKQTTVFVQILVTLRRLAYLKSYDYLWYDTIQF